MGSSHSGDEVHHARLRGFRELGRCRARLRRGAGIVAIVVAVGVLGRELVVEAGPDWVITVVLGLGSVAIGSIRLAGGFLDKDEGAERARRRRHLPGTEIALGMAEVVLGFALLTADIERVWPAVAVWGIVGGAALLHDANRRRRFARETPQAPSRALAQVTRVNLPAGGREGTRPMQGSHRTC